MYSVFRDRQDVTGGRLGEPRDFQQRLTDHTSLNDGNAGDGADTIRKGLGCALERRKHLGEMRAIVVGVPRAEHRIERAPHRDDRGDSTCDDGRNGRNLSLEANHVPQELSIERFHQLNSSGETRRSFGLSSEIRPLVMRITRSAMAAMAALWVITAVVVPSSRLTRSMAFKTSLPVS